MTRAKVDWSHKETLKTFKEEIKNSPDNLSAAFEKIAKRLGCSTATVSTNWYYNLRNQSPFFKMESSTKKKVNLKNTPRVNKGESLIHETVVSTKTVDGVKIVTVKKYYTT